MDRSEKLQNALSGLNGRLFRWEHKTFHVQKTRHDGRLYFVYTQLRTFVYESAEFEKFLEAITLLEGDAADEKLQTQMDESGTMWHGSDTRIFNNTKNDTDMSTENKQHDESVTAVITTAVNTTETVTGNLVNMFNKLSKNPSPETIEQAKAMCGLANAIVGVERLKMDFVKLSQGKK